MYNSVINPRPGPIHSHNKSDYNMELNSKFDNDKLQGSMNYISVNKKNVLVIGN
jgi:hypothetical protein